MERQELDKDDIEMLLVKVADNADVISSLVDVVDRLKEAGILDLLTGIVKDYMPTDVDFLGKFFSSKEFTMSLMKTLNVLISLSAAMGSEKNSDLIKGIMFNSENITDNVTDAVRNPKSYSPLKVGKLLADEDIKVSISALIAVMKAMGQILRKNLL